MFSLLKNHFSKHFVNHACGTLSDIRLIIVSYLLMKADKAGCWLGNTLLATMLCYFMYLKALLAQSVVVSQPFPFSVLTKMCKKAVMCCCVSGIISKNKIFELLEK